MEPRTMLPRLFILGLLATEVIGLVGGLTDESWELGFTGRFMGVPYMTQKCPQRAQSVPQVPSSQLHDGTEWDNMGHICGNPMPQGWTEGL